MIAQQIIFILIFSTATLLFTKKIRQLRRNIFLGRKEDLSNNPAQRWRNVMLLALGQKKMFRNPLVAIMHVVIYAGFIIINIEVVEIIVDGIINTHRVFAPYLGNIYTFLINSFEILAVGVIFVCAIFLLRRNIVRIKRLTSKELNGWPKTDANYILITEIILMSIFLTMNTSDQLLQARGHEHYLPTGNFIISSSLTSLLSGANTNTLFIIERSAWWIHIIGILAFLNYLPYSKHLHIVLAFPNAYYMPLKLKGTINNMPDVQKEVLYAMQPELAPTTTEATTHHKFGAKDVVDLSWKNLLDAYSCTECGRCTAACPANITGKVLSPRKIMMDTRDRLEEVGKNIHKNGLFIEDNKSLLRDYITQEELQACTTCQACVQECPVSIDPLSIILQLRRYLVMEESSAPPEWNAMFSNIENNFAPWKFSPDDRDKWMEAQ